MIRGIGVRNVIVGAGLAVLAACGNAQSPDVTNEENGAEMCRIAEPCANPLPV